MAVTYRGVNVERLISAATTNGTSVKAAAGSLLTVFAFNKNAAPRYLKLYDKASAPTVGTDTPFAVFGIPGNAAGAGFVMTLNLSSYGIPFATGIAFAIMGGIDDNDNTAIGAGDVALTYAWV